MIQVGLISTSDIHTGANHGGGGKGGGHGPAIPMGLVTARELNVLGSHGFDSAALSDLLEMVARGEFDPARLVDQRVTLEEGARVLESMRHASPTGIVMITQFGPSLSDPLRACRL
jgi:threonine dehydrogenase-like Zn-dependent dehydrogenase